MKNKKLNLSDLEVTSFVTSLDKSRLNTVKAGADAAVTPGCGNSFDRCPTLPLNECPVQSYNRDCPTVPVAECNPNSDVICFDLAYTNVRALNC
jgi:hypothetical protein